jgi:hypothetical protein
MLIPNVCLYYGKGITDDDKQLDVKWGHKVTMSCEVTARRIVNLELTTNLYSSRYHTHHKVTNGSDRGPHHTTEHGLLSGYKSLCAE